MRLCLLIILLASSANADRLGYCTLSNSGFCSAISVASASGAEPGPFDGTFNNTELNGNGHLMLTAASTSGDFTSAIANAGAPTTWSGIDWEAVLPFYKELTITNEVVANYPDISSSAINNTNLVAMWHLDESSGTIFDSSGNNRNSVDNSNLTYSASGVAGTAITCNGSNSNIDLRPAFGSTLNGTAPKSAVAWFKTSTNQDGAFMRFGVESAGQEFSLRLFSNNTINLDFGSAGPSASSIPYLDGNWHLAVGTYDGTTARLYVDAVLVDSLTYAANTQDAGWTVACNNGGSHYFNGSLDELAVYNRELTLSEIQEIYNDVPGKTPSEVLDIYSFNVPETIYLAKDLEALWHLNESSGNLVDATGTGHTTTAESSIGYNIASNFQTGIECNSSSATLAGTFPTGNADRTTSVWFKTASSPGGDTSFFSYGSGETWALIQNASTFGVALGGGPYVSASSTGFVDGEWHLFTATYNGTQIKIYLDGILKTTTSIAVNTTDSTGYFCRYTAGPTLYWTGFLDEAAIWSRELSADEILDLYKRGANRVKFQVRSCDDAACSGESWLGPDNTNATFFTELNNNTNQEDMDGTVLTTTPSMDFSNFGSLSVASNQYFQYKIFLETDDATYTPEVTDVVVVSP